MDRSDDVTRSRRFTAQSLGSQQNRPRIVTARDERVAVKPGGAANKSPQPSLEFRARQRLRTYAEASAILDRQVPANAAEARVTGRSTLTPKPLTEPTTPATTVAAMPEGAPTIPETGYANVVPEPPSPMAEVYVGNSPQLTEREAQEYDLAPTATAAMAAQEADTGFDPAPWLKLSQKMMRKLGLRLTLNGTWPTMPLARKRSSNRSSSKTISHRRNLPSLPRRQGHSGLTSARSRPSDPHGCHRRVNPSPEPARD